MRTFAQIFIFAALIYFGWNKPFKIWVDDARRMLGGKPAEVAPQEVVPPRPTPTPAPRIIPGIIRQPTPPRGDWMWNATHRGALDSPTPSPTGRP